MNFPRVPEGFDLSVNRLEVSLIDKRDPNMPMIVLTTEDDNAGAYLRLSLDAGPSGVTITAGELEDVAKIGRWLVAMHDSMNSEGADAGMGPAAAVTQHAE